MEDRGLKSLLSSIAGSFRGFLWRPHGANKGGHTFLIVMGQTVNNLTTHEITARSVNGEAIGNTKTASKFKVVTQNGLTWLVYVLSGPVSLTTSAQSLTVSSAYKGAVRVAKLKEAADESVLDKYMSVYAKSAQVTYQVSNDMATVQYKFNTNGTGDLLVMTWPHHRDQLSRTTKYVALQYLTIKGYMKAVEANPLVLTLPLTSIKWTPNKPIDPSCSQDDIGNPSPQDPFFTVARHKDWYAGLSWASGVPYNGAFRNEESTSEAVNGYYGLYTFGLVTNDQNLIDFARLLLATEIHSNRRYWHLKDDTNDPAYPRRLTEIWLQLRLEIAAIQILPLTPITEEVVDAVWGPAMYAYSAKEFNDPSVADDWRSVIYAAHATWDPVAAYKEAATLSAWGSGNSNTNTLHFIATRGTNGICSSAGVPTPLTDICVTLLSKSTGYYVNESSPVKAKALPTQAGRYIIQWMPGGFSIKSQTTGKYISGGNGGMVTASTAEVGGWESFQFKQVGQYWAIVANSNKMYAEVQADGTLKTSAGTVTDATLFIITADASNITTATPTSTTTTAEVMDDVEAEVDVPTTTSRSSTTMPSTTTAAPAPTSGNLTGSNYFYISSKSAGLYLISNAADVYVRASGTRQQATRYLVAAIQGKDNLFSVQDVKISQYVCAEAKGDQPLMANRRIALGWEYFSFEKQGQYWAIRADDNKKYVTLQGDKRIQATSDKVQDSALWVLTSNP
ncbi:glycoside hydrolase family 81 protein [Planoprotostelium fungivorum]|uniref:glucan endo-1,3-beta-D-glucosidase n=1 Tax=Planoprotostelium fungivorum TaxID=1890364 RepID=A0A2P6NZE6_9EUKA|nr:glycoside hydrolase family 81 protein [Planoprotostelium fungivorum]